MEDKLKFSQTNNDCLKNSLFMHWNLFSLSLQISNFILDFNFGGYFLESVIFADPTFCIAF